MQMGALGCQGLDTKDLETVTGHSGADLWLTWCRGSWGETHQTDLGVSAMD